MGCMIARQPQAGYFDRPWKLALFYALLANLPDFDYFLGLSNGSLNQYHRLFTHSVGFALMVGALCGVYFKTRGRRFTPMFALAFSACFSHVVLDFLGADTSVPHGVPALWPLSNAYFISPASLFNTLEKGEHVRDALAGVVKPHNLLSLLREVLIFGALFALQSWYLKNRHALKLRASSWSGISNPTGKDRP